MFKKLFIAHRPVRMGTDFQDGIWSIHKTQYSLHVGGKRWLFSTESYLGKIYQESKRALLQCEILGNREYLKDMFCKENENSTFHFMVSFSMLALGTVWSTSYRLWPYFLQGPWESYPWKKAPCLWNVKTVMIFHLWHYLSTKLRKWMDTTH